MALVDLLHSGGEPLHFYLLPFLIDDVSVLSQ